MEKFKKFIRRYSRQISHVCLLTICTLLITYSMPREKGTSFNFTEGAPWEHEQLIAEFSFDVPKSDEDIAAEKEIARKEAKPYFIFNPEAGKQAAKKMRGALNNNWIFNICIFRYV